MSEDLANVMGSFIETELNAYEEIYKELEEKDKEIERLNNIINELEKWLENINKLYKDTRISYVEAISDTLDKLQKLKGESK